MKASSPAQTLLLLLLAGVSLAGWLYGVHWKRVASGDLFTQDEMRLIRLQDQIGALTEENERLHQRVRELTGGAEETAPPAPAPPLGPAEEPLLPASPQKIETH